MGMAFGVFFYLLEENIGEQPDQDCCDMIMIRDFEVLL